MRANDVRVRMNECGGRGMPFLFAVDFDMEDGFFIEEPMRQTRVLFRTPRATNSLETSVQPIEMTPSPIAYDDYKRRFDMVMAGLMRGDSYLANLTVRTPVRLSPTLRDVFLRSTSPYGLFVPERFVCFSPERFVHIEGGVISTNPMKGTIDDAIPNAARVIMNDPKETAEHCTIVDLMRNDIGMVASGVRVERFRYIDRIVTRNGAILQVSSEITGQLPKNYLSHLGDIVFRMLPAGSISGAPKPSTLRLIRAAEPEPRGWYSGVFGYFDGRELDSAVMIRFIEQSGDEFFFHSGGGITVGSDPRSEYDEMLKKIYLPR